MSGLYLYCSVDKILQESLRYSLDEMLKVACCLRSDTKEVRYLEGVACGVVHHGSLRSSGISKLEHDRLHVGACGAYWLEKGCVTLATPDELAKSLSNKLMSSNGVAYGNYIIAIVDERNNQVVIENDLMGVYPLYYCIDTQGNLAVSSEIKSLVPFVAKEINYDAVSEMLAFGYIVSSDTLISGIKRVPPNTRLIFKDGALKLIKLNRPKFLRNKHVDQSFLKKLYDTFNLSIARYKEDSSDLVVSLSGGLDSRIAAVAAQQKGFTVNAFCAGVPGSLECQVASDFAQKNNINYFNHQFDGRHFSEWYEKSVWITEGRCPPGHIHFLDGILRGKTKSGLHLHGLIGDVVVGGDLDSSAAYASNKIGIEQCYNVMASLIYWPTDSLHGVFKKTSFNLEEIKQNTAMKIFEEIDFDGSYSDFLWFRYYFRMFGFIIPCLGSQIIPWADPVFPYIDQVFFELCASMNFEEIADRKLQIQWARKFYPEIENVPRVKDGVLIDVDITDPSAYLSGVSRLSKKNYAKYLVTRLSCGMINLPKKETYPYYDQWYRKSKATRNLFNHYLLSEQCLDRGLWGKSGIKRLMHDLCVGRNVWSALATILMIEIFCRQFIDGDHKKVFGEID
jgi:hypothetical protein